HQVHHVLGIPLGVDAADVPGPSGLSMVESEQSFGLESREELSREEWISPGLSVDQFRERQDAFRGNLNGILDQLRNVLFREGCKLDVFDAGSHPTDGFELSNQRMSRVDLVVSIGTDHQ